MEEHAGEYITATAMTEAVSTEVATDPSNATASHSLAPASVASTVLPLVDPGLIRHLSDLQDADTHGEDALPREDAIDPSLAAYSHSPDPATVAVTMPHLAGPEHIANPGDFQDEDTQGEEAVSQNVTADRSAAAALHSLGPASVAAMMPRLAGPKHTGQPGDLQDEDTQGEEAVSRDVATERSAAAASHYPVPASITATVLSLADHGGIRHVDDLRDGDTQGEKAMSREVATDRSAAAALHSPASAAVTATEASLADLGPVSYLIDLQSEDTQDAEATPTKVATTPSAPEDLQSPPPTSVTAADLPCIDPGPIKHLSGLQDEGIQGKQAVSAQFASASSMPADQFSPASISTAATELSLVDPGIMRDPRDLQDENNRGERKEGAVKSPSSAGLRDDGLIDDGENNWEAPSAFRAELSSAHRKLEEAAKGLEVAGRVVYSGRPDDGVTVRLAGVHYGAAVQVRYWQMQLLR